MACVSFQASAGWDKIIIIWHIDTHRVRSRLLGHAGWIQAVSFRDTDTSILASADDETAYLWNIFSGVCLQRFSVSSSRIASSLDVVSLVRFATIWFVQFDSYRTAKVC
jgi:WD40 repeat protein